MFFAGASRGLRLGEMNARARRSGSIPRCFEFAREGRAGDISGARPRTAHDIAVAYDNNPFFAGDFKFGLTAKDIRRREINAALADRVIAAFERSFDHPHFEAALRRGYLRADRVAKAVIRFSTPERLLRELNVPRDAKPNRPLKNSFCYRTLQIENCGITETFRVKIYEPRPGVVRSGVVSVFLAGLGLKAEASFHEQTRNNGMSQSSKLREALERGDMVVLVDAPGMGKSEDITWNNMFEARCRRRADGETLEEEKSSYYAVFIELMMPKVNALLKDDLLFRGLEVNFIGHSQGAAIPLMMLGHFGEKDLLAQIGRERLVISAIAPPFRIFMSIPNRNFTLSPK